jgi:hypothetical protein
MKLYLSIALMLVTLAGAQEKPVTSQPAAKPVTATGLPSQETVNAFMQKMFG